MSDTLDTTSDDEREPLEERVRRLERQLAAMNERFEVLLDNHQGLKERFLTLALATTPDPRFPFWTWYITHDIPDHTLDRLRFLLSRLTHRIENTSPLPRLATMEMDGALREIVEGQGAPSIQAIDAAVAEVIGMAHHRQVVEMFRALQAQGMHPSLCAHYLAQEETEDEPDGG